MVVGLKCFEMWRTPAAELFNLFGFDCLVRCTIDPNKLDGLIQQFEKSNFSDCETLSSIIGLIRQGKSTSDKQEKDLLGEIKDYVTEHLTEDISIESIAEVLHISYYYICHFFKQQTAVYPLWKSINHHRDLKLYDIPRKRNLRLRIWIAAGSLWLGNHPALLVRLGLCRIRAVRRNRGRTL